jgi:hypothetical protein
MQYAPEKTKPRTVCGAPKGHTKFREQQQPKVRLVGWASPTYDDITSQQTVCGAPEGHENTLNNFSFQE